MARKARVQVPGRRPRPCPDRAGDAAHVLKFWGAAADGMPENLKAEACYEVAMGDVELDEGPMGIILSYLQKEDHEN